MDHLRALWLVAKAKGEAEADALVAAFADEPPPTRGAGRVMAEMLEYNWASLSELERHYGAERVSTELSKMDSYRAMLRAERMVIVPISYGPETYVPFTHKSRAYRARSRRMDIMWLLAKRGYIPKSLHHLRVLVQDINWEPHEPAPEYKARLQSALAAAEIDAMIFAQINKADRSGES